METLKSLPKTPSFIVEHVFFVILLYGMLGEVLGISISLLGAGLLAGLAVLCVMHAGQHLVGVLRPCALALGCAMVMLLVQSVFHDESFLLVQDMRTTVTWLFSLIVIQTLSLRKGFLHRFAVVAFLAGCATLPFLDVYVETDEMVRVGTRGVGGLSNPNAFGMWFGFCFVYFLVAGLEARNYLVRVASWSAGFLCLYLVAITVSRGPLLSMAIATVLAFQRVLKRSFLPILILLVIAWIVYMSGLFDDLIGYYTTRGNEDTGRSYLWSEGFRRFLSSVIIGEGFSNAVIAKPGSSYMMGPHNSLLYIGLSSGLVPLVLFVGYLIRAVGGAFRARFKRTRDAPFLFPLSIYACLEMMLLSEVHISFWTMVVFSIAGAAGYASRSSLTTISKVDTNSGQQTKRNDVLAGIQKNA